MSNLCSFVAFEGCTFHRTDDTSADGAEEVEDADTVEECLRACKNADNCFAVEFSTEYGCYMHTSDAFGNQLRPNTGVTIYEKTSCGK